MRNALRTSVKSAAAGLVLVGGLALGAAPIAAATSDSPAPPKPMQIDASGGDATAINSTGTQGTMGNSVQGTIDPDGDQDAFNYTSAEQALPQENPNPGCASKHKSVNPGGLC